LKLFQVYIAFQEHN